MNLEEEQVEEREEEGFDYEKYMEVLTGKKGSNGVRH